MGCGKVYELDFGRYRGYEKKGWQPHVKYRVGNLKDLHAHVIPFFHPYPLFGRKAQAFELFALLVEALQRKEHLTDGGLKALKELVARLSAHNQRGRSKTA